MTISTQAQAGIQVNSAAMDSASNATVLGSQAAITADNEIVVPHAITTNNEGNLESTPTYVGRLIAIRWGATGVDTVAINAGGSGYVNGDILTLSGGTFTTAARLRVTSVDGGGVIQAVRLVIAADAASNIAVGEEVGEYSVEPSNPVSHTGGTGTGATFNLTFKDVQEVRFIIADASNTLTVNEDWIDGPDQNQNWRVCYVIQDAATVTGLTLINKRVSDYSSNRRFQVTNAETNGGWCAFLEGVSLETNDNGSTTVADFTVNSGGRFDNGYLQGGVPVSGGYIIGTPATNGEFVMDVDPGSTLKLYDFFLTCVFQNKVNLNGDVHVRGGKFFSASHSMDMTGSAGNPVLLEDIQIEGKGATTDTLTIDADTIIDGALIISTNGFRMGTAAETVTVKNVQMLDNNLNFVTVPDNASAIFEFLNPTWNLDTSDQTQIAFTGTTNGLVREQYTVDITVFENNGTTPLSGTHVKLLSTGDSILVNTITTGADGLANEIKTVRSITPNGASALTVVSQLGHYSRLDKYTWQPFVLRHSEPEPVESTVAMQIDPDITETNQATAISNGSGITYGRQMELDYDGQTGNFTVGLVVTGATSGATGTILVDTDAGTSGTLLLENVVGIFDDNETITDTSTGSATVNEPTVGGNPIQALLNRVNYFLIEYETGNGTALQIGETVTVTNAGTDTTGEVKAVIGDGTSGFVLLENWNGTFPDAAATLSGGTSGHSSSTTNPINTFQFGYYIDGNSKSLPTIYDYQQARFAEATLTQEFEDLLAIFVGADGGKPLELTGAGWVTNDVPDGGFGTGFFIGNFTGTVVSMEDNGSNVFTVPTQVSFNLTGLVAGSEVRVYEDTTDVPRNELAGTESSGTTFGFTYTFGGAPTDAYVIIHHVDYIWERLEVSLGASDQTIPVSQRLDRNFLNPA